MNSAALKRWLPFAAIAALALPALWPYTQGWPLTADGTLHLLRTLLLDIHLQRGMLYPRWVPELVLGFGYPVFSFYGPAAFYLADLFHWLGLSYSHAVMAALTLMVVAGGWGMYALARDVLGEPNGRWGSLVAAVAYLYAPYLLTNVFVRGAIGEVGAQALLPWIYWSFRRVLRHPQPARWVLPAALSLGGLAVTHNITLLFLPPALVVYLGALWWQAGRDRLRLIWTVAAGAAAMGLSAFFWLPLIGERQFLSDTAYRLSAQLFIPENIWTWRNFLDTGFTYTYDTAIPFQLGLVQAAAGLAGFALAGRRDGEWLYWSGLAVLAGLGMSTLVLKVWLSSDLLQVAQFPWRLLSFMSLALALLTGGMVRRLPGRRRPGLAAAAIIGILILANRPQLPATQFEVIEDDDLDLASVAQFEAETAGLGTSSTREFMPRWVQDIVLENAGRAMAGTEALTVRLESANPYQVHAVVTSAIPAALRFTAFYFPGWQVKLDGRPTLKVSPTTTLGLLTVDVPAGTHQLDIDWQGTPLQSGAAIASLVTLAALGLLSLRQPAQRWLGAAPLALLLFGAVATFKPLPEPELLQHPPQPLTAYGLQLLGLRTERASPAYVYVHPYWRVHATPPRVQAHWQLRDSQGLAVSDVILEPYFNAYRSDNWPADTVVDDAYQLPLPPGLPAGDYELWLALQPAGADSSAELARVGTVFLDPVPGPNEAAPSQTAGAIFDNTARLAGYDLSLNNRPAPVVEPLTVVRPGDVLAFTLYWQPLRPLATNYHGMVHLLDTRQGSLAQRDQLAGSWYGAPRVWDPFRLNPDRYVLQVPADAPGGVYWPHVGLYHFSTLDRLPVASATGEALGDNYALAPLKVVPRGVPQPQHQVSARFEGVSTLLGYDLSLPAGGVRASDLVTLTVYYRADETTSADYTRFVHIYSPELGMAGQVDSAPQQGLNPTWSWVPGEVIVDQVVIPLAPEAAPGTYTVRLGLYDAAAAGTRVTIFDQDGSPLPDGAVDLAELALDP